MVNSDSFFIYFFSFVTTGLTQSVVLTKSLNKDEILADFPDIFVY